MSDTAIRVEHLSKRYRIGGPQTQYKTIRETLMDVTGAPVRRLRRLGQPMPEEETIWALKDVSFEVKHGEVLGIIGRNGAGKTTLLKILSRITEPTEGHAEINGRVGSLLEVGTGFHPELTGRENIYLNGAILGMQRAEIDERFDEIVAFSEIEKFIDTPVKRYSSGMYVRLAFAVAAHLEPEILLVDEVLAVGDAAFQKKCLGKMGDVAAEGRTVLFVSHNMGAIDRLCESAVLLTRGKIAHKGAPRDTIERYLVKPEDVVGSWNADDRQSDSSLPISLTSAYCARESTSTATSLVPYDEPFRLIAVYRVRRAVRTWSLALRVADHAGNVVFASSDADGQCHADRRQSPNSYRAICHVPSRLLRPGIYSVTIITHIHGVRILESHEDAFRFEVSATGYTLGAGRVGVITPSLKWTIEPL
ncbi:MAG: ATP-binding cassette domain-containing protein [Anaerolineae bacterium]|nr:ATP-binding cassette domain-containing protein [Anaerolineae bacterium]NIN94264.1 ATP-binding cassette domain-containing protein [Anaerolineae bacterium]NIQ77332.1 ATP-binding cassette domain-containing protein [Anaerolineae bacterium]